MIMWYFVFVSLKGTILNVLLEFQNILYTNYMYVTWYWRIGLIIGNISKRLIMTLNDPEHRITYLVVNKTHIDCLNLWIAVKCCRE